MIKWQDVLTRGGLVWKDEYTPVLDTAIRTLPDMLRFLDAVHIRMCLAKPYADNPSYPLVEPRELLPTFDNPMYEYKNLPGFSMVAFYRPLKYFDERFQYDRLLPSMPDGSADDRAATAQNMQTFLARLPRVHQDVFRMQFAKADLSLLENYPALMPYLTNLDRAHVISLGPSGSFFLSGIFASFTNNIDTVLKRFGLHIGKFRHGDSELYAKNRIFVYQFLMELYGFPIVSERRTSAAMFARTLYKRGEPFILRVLGQTDRTITTYISDGSSHSFYPVIEKTALVAVDRDQEEALGIIGKEGFFLDSERRVVILRVRYTQHRYNPSNVRQDRALSVVSQEIIHPITGRVLKGLNIIRDATNMYLRLNDMVRGEYTGRVIYKRNEIIESTDTHEKRLKVIYAWLTKNQRRIIDYSDEFYDKVSGVLAGYLYSPAHDEEFANLRELHREVCARVSYIQQARRVRVLEDLRSRRYHGERLTWKRTLAIALDLATNLKFEIVNFFPELLEKALFSLDHILSDRYLVRTYIRAPEGAKQRRDSQAIRKSYGALVQASDELRQAMKFRKKPVSETEAQPKQLKKSAARARAGAPVPEKEGSPAA